jgi:O-antigen ligase
MEAVLLLLVCASPWAYGAVHPGFEFLLDAGLCLLLFLWGLCMLLEGRLSWKKCPVTLCLAGLFLYGLWQVTPLPRSVLERLSPSTAALYDRLLPDQPEVLPSTEPAAQARAPAESPGSTLSLYPTATRRRLARLLAVFLVFVLVRNNLASAASLWRLSLAAVSNGVLLAVFALAQHFSSPQDMLYWSYPSQGIVFGPFICRNHYPFYINLCVGLGGGLILAHQARKTKIAGRAPRSALRAPWSRNLLQDPFPLWVGVALAFMLSSVAFCLSRGGFLALVGAALGCTLLCGFRGRLSACWGTGLVIGALAVALVVWFGGRLVQQRLGTLWQGKVLQDRLPFWSRIVPLIGEFPLWGTGYATLQYVEPLKRNPNDVPLLYNHAHNDYLEILVEGGVVALALALLAIGLVIRLGRRAVLRGEGRSAGGLALGALFAFLTLVIHSFGDFGAHVPAVTLLAAVVAAHLCALGSADRPGERRGVSPPWDGDHGGLTPGRSPETVGGPEYRLRLGGVAPVLGAATAAALGLLLCGWGWKAHRVERLQWAAARLRADRSPDRLRRRINYLEAAARLAPEDAGVQADLGQAYYDLFYSRSGRLAPVTLPAGRFALLAATGRALPAVGIPPGLAAAPGWALATAARRTTVREDKQARLVRTCLVPGLRHFLRARDLCPLAIDPQWQIAMNVEALTRAEPRRAYLDRTKLLAPCEAEVWFSSGREELRDRQPEQAWGDWRRCLELSVDYLPRILALSAPLLRPEELAAKVLPDRPELLLAAADRLYPQGDEEGRRPFLRRARDLLGKRSQLGPEDQHVKALVHQGLGEEAEAEAAFRAALRLAPLKAGWRFQFARFLYEQERREEAQRELAVVVAQQPDNAPARELWRIVTLEIAKKQ